MDTEDQSCDEQLKVVVRKREFSVSKKYICSVMPYFQKMFCCDLLESEENKVKLDFDDTVLPFILNWIHSESYTIQMDYVISLYDDADHLMINDRLFKKCFSYFHENFTIEHIPVVLPQVTKVSKLINSEAINNFICRHFLAIANTEIFFGYPIETVEAILKLDLMVYSEYQILEVILKWLISKATDLSENTVKRLFQCVRWSLFNAKDKELILNGFDGDCLKKGLPFMLTRIFWIASGSRDFFEINLNKFIEIKSHIATHEEFEFYRNEQNFFISIQQKDDKNIRINMFDDELRYLPIGNFTRDDSMSLEFVHGENISDISFDSGTKGVRIDWIKKTFRWLDFKVKGKTYYSQLMKFMVKFSFFATSFSCYLEDKNAKFPNEVSTEESLLIESNGEFILIGKTLEEKKWFGIFPVTDPDWFNNYEDHKRSFQATVLDDVVYILTKDLEFIRFNRKTRLFKKCDLFKDDGLDFNDLVLCSHAKNDDKVILVSKSSGKVHFYLTDQKQWVEKCRILGVNACLNLNAEPHELIGFTSTFLPMKVIKTSVFNQ